MLSWEVYKIQKDQKYSNYHFWRTGHKHKVLGAKGGGYCAFSLHLTSPMCMHAHWWTSHLSFPTPSDLPDSEIKLTSLYVSWTGRWILYHRATWEAPTLLKKWCVHARSLQLCGVRLCNPMDYSSPGSSVHGILQARILEWVAISSSRISSGPMDWTYHS